MRNVIGLALCATLSFTSAIVAQERPAAPADPQTLVAYDTKVISRRFTTPDIILRGDPPQIIVTAYYGEYGEKIDRPKDVSFCVRERHAENIWADRDIMKLRAGDKTYEYEIYHKSSPFGKEVVETAIVLIPVAVFEEMVTKDALHFQIRQTSDVLEKAWLEPLKHLSAQLPKKFYVYDRPAAPSPATPVTSYNAAKNMTTVTTPVIRLKAPPAHVSSLQMEASYSFNGKVAQRPATVEVVFSQQHKSWGYSKWKEAERVRVQVAANHYDYAATILTTPLGDGGSQTATISIPLTDLQQMLEGGSILFGLGLHYEPIQDEWLKPIEELLATLPRQGNVPQ